MARIRSLKPEFWNDEKLSVLDPLTRLVFVGLISHADDVGRLVDNVKLLDGLMFPSTQDSCAEALDTFARLGRIQRYTAGNGQQVIQILKWKDHQKVDKPSKRVLPGPETAIAQKPTTRAPTPPTPPPTQAKPPQEFSGDTNGVEPPSLPYIGESPASVSRDSREVLGTDGDGDRDMDRDRSSGSRSENHATTTDDQNRIDDEAARLYAIGLTTTANNAIAKRWGEGTRTRPLFWHHASNQATEYLRLGIPLQVAQAAIVDSIERSKKPEPPYGMNYFDGPITDAFKATQQRQLDAENPAPASRRGGPSSRMSVKLDRDQVHVTADADEERRLKPAYELAQNAAAHAWATDTANEKHFREITAAAADEYAMMIETEWGKKARNQRIAIRCAEAAGFPSFAAWRAAHDGGAGGVAPMTGEAEEQP